MTFKGRGLTRAGAKAAGLLLIGLVGLGAGAKAGFDVNDSAAQQAKELRATALPLAEDAARQVENHAVDVNTVIIPLEGIGTLIYAGLALERGVFRRRRWGKAAEANLRQANAAGLGKPLSDVIDPQGDPIELAEAAAQHYDRAATTAWTKPGHRKWQMSADAVTLSITNHRKLNGPS